MNWIKDVYRRLAVWLRSGEARRDLDVMLAAAAKALPIIAITADIATGLTPTRIDDVAWALVKVKFPSLFDGRPKTADELKLAAMAAATELLRKQFPNASTTVLRLAVQAAFLEAQHG